MSNELAVIKRLDEIAQSASNIFNASSFEGAIAVAQAMSELRANLSPQIMEKFMTLQNTSLGFRTDRDPSQGKEPYPVDVVKECVIEATLRGLPPVGNCFNIISGRVYATRQGLEYQLRKLNGFANLSTDLGIPRTSVDAQGNTKGAVVPCKASWVKDGAKQSLSAEIPVRVNNAMGVDAILGKALRKLLARVYAQVTGSATIPEGEAGEEPEVTPTTLAPAKTHVQLVAPPEVEAKPTHVEVAIQQNPTPVPEVHVEAVNTVAAPKPAAPPVEQDPILHEVIKQTITKIEEAGCTEAKVMAWGKKAKHWPGTVGSLLSLYQFDQTKFNMVCKNIGHIVGQIK